MNKKNMAVASLALSIISLIPLVVNLDSLNSMMIFTAVFVLIAIVGIILGFVGKSEKKGIAITGIVIGIISCIVLGMAIIGLATMKDATNCVKKDDSTYKCELFGEDFEMPASYVSEAQKAK